MTVDRSADLKNKKGTFDMPGASRCHFQRPIHQAPATRGRGRETAH
jgi:hypothetical protein